jgi:hypothetical protein
VFAFSGVAVYFGDTKSKKKISQQGKKKKILLFSSSRRSVPYGISLIEVVCRVRQTTGDTKKVAHPEP